MDETYIKVKDKWVYLYRAVDKEGNPVDFMLSENRDEPAAKAFFEKAIGSIGIPDKITMDKRGAYKADIATINLQLALLFMMGGVFLQMKGFKAFHSANATLSGIELHHMLKNGQHTQSDNRTIFKELYGLSA